MTRGVRSGGGKSKKLNRVFKTFIKRVKENLCTTLYRHGWRYMFLGILSFFSNNDLIAKKYPK